MPPHNPDLPLDDDLVSDALQALDLFDAAPVSLWLEDYSGVKELFDLWREQGVTDLRSFLLDDLARITACAQSIRLLRVNQATLRQFAAQSLEELTWRLGEVLRDDTLEHYLEELEQLWSGKLAFESQTVNYALDGRRLDILLKGRILPGHEERWDRVLVAIEDVSALESARKELATKERLARGIFEHAPVSLWVEDFSVIKSLMDEVREQGIRDFRVFTDVHPEFVDRCLSEIRVIDVNRHTLQLFKATDKHELIRRLPRIFREDSHAHFREQLIDLWEGRLYHEREVVNYALDGNPLNIHLQFSVFAGSEDDWSMVLLALVDITARKKAEAYLEYLGKHDVLTQLRNRSFFVDELNRLERKGPLPITVVNIDMDDLKKANDTLGHSVGDALLRRAGEVLTKAVDKPATVSRVGGDEFVILIPNADIEAGQAVMDSIQQLVELNNQFYGSPPLRFSMGMATCYQRGGLAAALRDADAAMYEDKRQQRAGGPS